MLLRVGAASMLFALLLALVVALFMAFRDGPAEAEIRPVAEPAREEAVPPEPRPERPRPEEPEPELIGEGWDAPSGDDVAAAGGPRRYGLTPGAVMSLTIPALQIYDAPVYDSAGPEAMYNGVAHVPETSMPWDEGTQKNVYLAAHRIGYEGSGSRMLFYYLHWLDRGDEVLLKGQQGQIYRYRVTMEMVVPPSATWVMAQERGKDLLSLQTCTPIPTFQNRLVVRAERV